MKPFEIARKEGIERPLLVHMHSENTSFVFVPKEVEKHLLLVKFGKKYGVKIKLVLPIQCT